MRLREILNESKLEDYFGSGELESLKDVEKMWAREKKDPGFINQEYHPTYLARAIKYINEHPSPRDLEIDEFWDWFILANRLNNWNPNDYYGMPGMETIRHFLGKGPIAKPKRSIHLSKLTGAWFMQQVADSEALQSSQRLINKVSGTKNPVYVKVGQELLKYSKIIDLKTELKEIADDMINGHLKGAGNLLRKAYTQTYIFREIDDASFKELKKSVDDVLRKHDVYDDFYDSVQL